MYIIVAKKFKSAYSYCPNYNYILNGILSNFMVNKKVKHKKMLPGAKITFALQF
jgi:hypothetical protein